MKTGPQRSLLKPATRRAVLASIAGTAIVLAAGEPARARRGRGRGGRDHEDDDDGYHERDYEQAREAVGTGAALPLSEIIIEVRKVIDGDVLDVELLREGSAITYRIRMLTAKGTYHQVFVDAKTKSILKIEQQ